MAKHIDILKFDWAGAAREAGKEVDAGYKRTGNKPFGIKDLEANPSLRLARPVGETALFVSEKPVVAAVAAAAVKNMDVKTVKVPRRTGLSHGR